MSKRLLDQLPDEVFPSALATQYWRIVNVIALHWNNGPDCSEYFNRLLTDQRGGRQGFPTSVQRDLVRLLSYTWRTRRLRVGSGAVHASDGRDQCSAHAGRDVDDLSRAEMIAFGAFCAVAC